MGKKKKVRELKGEENGGKEGKGRGTAKNGRKKEGELQTMEG